MAARLHRFTFVLLLGTASCQTDQSWTVPSGAESTFETEVYPVLLRDCAFHTCHGAEQRFFRVWGPGRVRLGDFGEFQAYDPKSIPPRYPSPLEVSTSYQRAVALIDLRDPPHSLLLRKPLATAAGGAGHLGADKFGRNVYSTVDSEGYVKLSRWVFLVATSKR